MIKVLVADDERWIRKGIVRMIDRELNEIGEVLEAETVKQALHIFEEEMPDIVLSDVMFPTENGCDLGERIYELNPGVKIVMISAFDDFNNARRALRFRAVDYLLKPVSKEQLNQIITKCVRELKEEHGLLSDVNLEKEQNDHLPDGDATSVQLIEKMMRAIREDCSRRYTLSEMAGECHVTETYFSGLFKKTAGISPLSYVTRVRVEKAKELMMTTEYKLVQIAAAVGYEDYQYFTRVFKKAVGETPGEYKSRMMKEIGNEDNRPSCE